MRLSLLKLKDSSMEVEIWRERKWWGSGANMQSSGSLKGVEANSARDWPENTSSDWILEVENLGVAV